MKTSKIIGYVLLTASFAIIGIAGCTPQSTVPTPPLAPGYQNPQDQNIGQTLSAMHQFYNTLADEAKAGTFVPSQQEKTALNDFAAALNIAQSAYIAYHNGLGSEVQAQALTNEAQSKQLAVQAMLPKGNQ